LVVILELIGEEIYDEFDLSGPQALAASTYLPPEAQAAVSAPPATTNGPTPPPPTTPAGKSKPPSLKVPLPKMAVPSFGGFGILRTRSAPGTPRGVTPSLPHVAAPVPNTFADAIGEKLEHIKEVNTPSPTELKDPHENPTTKMEADQEKDSNVKRADNFKGAPPERASTLDSATTYGPIPSVNVEIARPSSTPPSPTASKVPLPNPTPASGTTTPSVPSGRTAPSLLTEAVLRGRQARLTPSQAAGLSGADGTATPNPGARPTLKGRFKSRRLDGAPPSPPLPVPKASGARKSEEGLPTQAAEEDRD
jgi:metal transporter CNNM